MYMRQVSSKKFYRMKLSGMSQTAIANALNKQGVLSPMEYKHSLGIRIQDNFKNTRTGRMERHVGKKNP